MVQGLLAACAALTLCACATSSAPNAPRQSLNWDGDLITWTVENPSQHPITIDEYRDDDMGVPQGVAIKVTDATGERLAYGLDDNDGWYSPWMMWSEAHYWRPLEMAAGARFQHTFTAADMTTGLKVTVPIATDTCRYQIRVQVWRPRGRTPAASLTSEWKDIACSALRVDYCPLEYGILNCGGGPLPEVLRPTHAPPKASRSTASGTASISQGSGSRFARPG